jgi:hypothetical protein
VSSEAAAAYRSLALTVIDRAFRDLIVGPCSPADRDSAAEFLAGSGMMQHWCRVAALDPGRVIARAVRLRNGGNHDPWIPTGTKSSSPRARY